MRSRRPTVKLLIAFFTLLTTSLLGSLLIGFQLHSFNFDARSNGLIGLAPGTAPLPHPPPGHNITNVDKQQPEPSDDGADQAGFLENVIAVVVSITGCGEDPITEGAAVLHHSVRLVFWNSTKYSYRIYAIVHPDALECGRELAELGYTILVRDTPVRVEEIRGPVLRERIVRNGCCGEKELVKLEALTLHQHPIVVHMDLDTIMLKPMDNLYDVMLGKTKSKRKLEVMWNKLPLPDYIELAYTHDYNTVGPARKYKPIQGGLLVFRPNMKTYEDLREVVREGNYSNTTGWGGGIVRPSYGAMTIQGLLPYYYLYLEGGRKSLELNRCVFNQMSDNPRMGKTTGDVVSGRCRTGQPVRKCEDCRKRPLEDIRTVHFTVCQKPWWCQMCQYDSLNWRLCRRLHHEWHRIRADLEHSWGRRLYGDRNFDRDHFFGRCSDRGKRGYHRIEKPYGPMNTTPNLLRSG